MRREIKGTNAREIFHIQLESAALAYRAVTEALSAFYYTEEEMGNSRLKEAAEKIKEPLRVALQKGKQVGEVFMHLGGGSDNRWQSLGSNMEGSLYVENGSHKVRYRPRGENAHVYVDTTDNFIDAEGGEEVVVRKVGGKYVEKVAEGLRVIDREWSDWRHKKGIREDEIKRYEDGEQRLTGLKADRSPLPPDPGEEPPAEFVSYEEVTSLLRILTETLNKAAEGLRTLAAEKTK